jgi:Exopolysaccharide biosynthesis protein
MKIRLILWGIGKIYNSMINLLKFYDDADQIDIVGITAQNLPDYKYLDGYQLLSMKEVRTTEYDYVMVLSDDYFTEIVDSAMTISNVPREKIVSYHVMEIPYFNFFQYDFIKKQKISIVSNNCWGGVIYHTLGMECLSPFKNVSFSSWDYIKIVSNLKHYLSIDPIWTGKKEMDSNQNREVPMLQLDDVFIKCNHDLDAERAIHNWIRRRDKFNWNNILIEMYTEDPKVEKTFGKVTEQFHNRICFVPYESDEQYSMRLPLMRGQTKFYEAVNANAGIGKNAIAYNILAVMEGKQRFRVV